MTAVAINGFGRVGRCASAPPTSAAPTSNGSAINDLADAARSRTCCATTASTARSRRGRGRATARSSSTAPHPRARRAGPGGAAVGELGVDVVIESHRPLPHARRGRRASRGRRPQGDRLGAGKAGSTRRSFSASTSRAYDPSATRHLERLVHDELPRAGRQGPARGGRHPPRRDDDLHAYTGDQRLVDLPHKDPRRARAAALEHHPDHDGRRQGDRARVPELDGRLLGLAVARPGPDRLARRPRGRGRAADDGRGDQRRLSRAAPTRGSTGSSVQRGAARLDRHDRLAVLRPLRRRLTSVIGGTLVKVVAWYDNEWGYSSRVVELAAAGAGSGPQRRSD